MKRIATLCLVFSVLPAPVLAMDASSEDLAAVHWMAREVEIVRVLDELSRRAVRSPVLFRDVAVVDTAGGRVKPHGSVLVANGKIVGDDHKPDDSGAKDAMIIDGSGLYLSPGLVDMHVHTESLGEQLLRLAVGITTVREMDGFPWMLRLRSTVRAGGLIAPTAYVAGTIIADRPFGDYTVVVATEDEARREVARQSAFGYDFIKVHNRLAEPLFDAVADAAGRNHLDLVGHVPHDISIDHAVHSGRMRTLEHLKGFIDDGDFSVSDEDFAAALAGATVWLTPTFSAGMKPGLTGEDARRELDRPEMRYISSTRLARWREWVSVEPDWRERLRSSLPESIRAIAPLPMPQRLRMAYPDAMARLLPLHPRWLAGTDAAGYEFQVAGFELLEEMREMERQGLPRDVVLRSATSEPAVAMRREREFGAIAPGLRADLVLLDHDPQADLSAYRSNRGVMVAGAWLDRAALDVALDQLARIQAERDEDFPLTPESARALARQVLELDARGIPLDPMMTAPAIVALRKLGEQQAADELAAAAVGLPPALD